VRYPLVASRVCPKKVVPYRYGLPNHNETAMRALCKEGRQGQEVRSTLAKRAPREQILTITTLRDPSNAGFMHEETLMIYCIHHPRAAKPSLNVLLDVVQQTIGVNDALLVTLFEPVRTAVIRVVDRTAFLRVIRISKSRVKRAEQGNVRPRTGGLSVQKRLQAAQSGPISMMWDEQNPES
jgi:hypothetical protein